MLLQRQTSEVMKHALRYSHSVIQVFAQIPEEAIAASVSRFCN